MGDPLSLILSNAHLEECMSLLLLRAHPIDHCFVFPKGKHIDGHVWQASPWGGSAENEPDKVGTFSGLVPEGSESICMLASSKVGGVERWRHRDVEGSADGARPSSAVTEDEGEEGGKTTMGVGSL